jgi:hypothetical protein
MHNCLKAPMLLPKKMLPQNLLLKRMTLRLQRLLEVRSDGRQSKCFGQVVKV